MPVDNKSARRRHIRRHGNDVTLIIATETNETDNYGDPVFDETTKTTRAMVEIDTNNPREVSLDSGQELVTPVTVYMPDTVEIPDKEETVRWIRIEDSSANNRYLLKQRFTSPDGLHRCYCTID